MNTLANIEFFADQQGNVLFRDDQGVRTLTSDHRDVVGSMFRLIEEDYPKAFQTLSEIYTKSISNLPYFQFLVVHRFIRCNFSRIDRKLDIDHLGRLVFEECDCPMAGECRAWRVVCNPERSTRLTDRQREVMDLYCEGKSVDEIADRLYISPETVRTTKRNAFAKVGAHDIREFIAKTNLPHNGRK